MSSIIALAALGWAFAISPFTHLHPEELDRHQIAGTMHFHVEGDLRDGGTLLSERTADDDDIDVSWNALARTDAPFFFECKACLTPNAPDLHTLVLLGLDSDHQATDPPISSCRQTRAPPTA